MVIVRNSVVGAAIVCGLAGGFSLDRRAASSPLREYQRTPEIARDPNVYEDDLAGWGESAMVIVAPGLAALASGALYGFLALGQFGTERHTSRHPLGMLALATTVAGASAMSGAAMSRIVLG